MPNWRVKTIKEVGDYLWQNTWTVNAATLAIAKSAAEELTVFECTFLPTFATVLTAHINEWVGTSTGPLNRHPMFNPGTRGGTIGDYQPAENVARVALVAVAGRNGAKALRYSLKKTDTTAAGKGAIYDPSQPTSFAALFNAAATTLITNLNGLNAVLMIGKDPAAFHANNTLDRGKPSWQDVEHGWFNRSQL